ncbi:MAG: hypothetical protein ACXVNM_14490 [Bacteroidia bacterium]
MKKITVTFANQNFLDRLMADELFNVDTAYLNPVRTNATTLELTDTLENHDILSAEAVVLAHCGRAAKRVLFNNLGEIHYNSPNALLPKGGINHNGIAPIITATQLQMI